MDIVHVDPGYGKFMRNVNIAGNEYGTFEYVENATYNPYSDVAFTVISGNILVLPNLDFTFEPTAGQLYKKVWSVKFSVYMNSNVSGFSAGFSDTTNSGGINNIDVGVSLGNTSSRIAKFIRFVSGATEEKEIQNPLPTTAGFHNVSITYSVTSEATGNTYSSSTIMIDDEVDFQYSAGFAYVPQIFYFNYAIAAFQKFYVSNVLAGQASYEGDGTGSIPSDDGIPANTPVYRLPLGTPDTNGFELNEDGIYVANTNGSTLLQTVNASSLVTTHGNRPVNHIVAYGNPGYRVGTAVTAATGISKSGNVITPHGTHTLSFEKDMHVYDVWKIAEGSTFNDINGLQVGWRAGE